MIPMYVPADQSRPRLPLALMPCIYVRLFNQPCPTHGTHNLENVA